MEIVLLCVTGIAVIVIRTFSAASNANARARRLAWSMCVQRVPTCIASFIIASLLNSSNQPRSINREKEGETELKTNTPEAQVKGHGNIPCFYQISSFILFEHNWLWTVWNAIKRTFALVTCDCGVHYRSEYLDELIGLLVRPSPLPMSIMDAHNGNMYFAKHFDVYIVLQRIMYV